MAGSTALLLSACALAVFWYGYAFPQHHNSHIDQIEHKAVQVARVFEAIVGHDALFSGDLSVEDARVLEKGRENAGMLKIRIFDSAGVIIHSSELEEIGEVNEHDYFWRHFLRQRDCALGQGYLFSPPVPLEAFNRLLLDDATATLVPAIDAIPGTVPAT